MEFRKRFWNWFRIRCDKREPHQNGDRCKAVVWGFCLCTFDFCCEMSEEVDEICPAIELENVAAHAMSALRAACDEGMEVSGNIKELMEALGCEDEEGGEAA